MVSTQIANCISKWCLGRPKVQTATQNGGCPSAGSPRHHFNIELQLSVSYNVSYRQPWINCRGAGGVGYVTGLLALA